MRTARNKTIDFDSIVNCPFCGDDDGTFLDFKNEAGSTRYYSYVICVVCESKGPVHVCEGLTRTADGAILKWNLWALMIKATKVRISGE